ncbi:hypothetical protein AU210_007581 [Fusarium oxysporum f. sp. radicis-cucumerinum]|uniref:Uncharacterized protein n=1 Tax=Fusarium oxysporum f. sp. radicis-cucumerinum TaxID=327505 RepID=A0A2H3HET9_FUSOX|nr:hypothetical protein AU210_007581 [Fusarium oxysporum f. sp. radicis-cucumerinum]
MNWTEGALARHSRRKGWDKDAARQKQYFAKARARKNAPTTSKGIDISSFVPDYIPQPTSSQGRQSNSSTPRWKQRTTRGKRIHRQSETENSHKKRNGRGREPRIGNQGLEAESSPTSPQDKDKQELAIATKRRRLLEKPDWTGVITQKPVTVDFSQQRDRSTKLLAKPTSRSDHRSTYSPDPKDQPNKRTLGRLSENDIEINIGSQNLRWSRDSNSVRSFATRQNFISRLEIPQSNNATSQASVSSYQQSRSLRHHRERPPRAHDFRGSQTPNERSNPLTSLSSAVHSLGQEEWLARETDEPRYVVQTHAPIIHQPQPTRRRHQVIEAKSPELDEGASAVAVLGTSRLSDRITAEDIRWNMWLESTTKPRQQQLVQPSRDKGPPRPISPSLSNYTNTFNDKSRIENLISSENQGQNSSHANEEPQLRSSETYPSSIPPSESQHEPLDDEQELPELQARDPFANLPPATGPYALLRSSSYERSETNLKTRSDLVLPMGSFTPVASNVQDLLDLLTASEEQQEPNIEDQTQQETTPNADDEDEIWKKFVLDNDSAETSRKAREEAHEQTKCALGLKKPHVPRMFVESSLPSCSTAPSSDIADSPSASRGEAPTTEGRNFILADDQIQDLPGAELEAPSSEAAARVHIADATDSIIAQPASPQPLHAEFKFRQPQHFVGRLAGDVPSAKSPVYLDKPRSKGRRQRSRRRRDKGRPDFRTMPNYNDDPIEED